MYYWFRLHEYDEIFYWVEDEQEVKRLFGSRKGEQGSLEEMDVILMYNREDRHWCYDPSVDLSDFTEVDCGTVTMYVRQ